MDKHNIIIKTSCFCRKISSSFNEFFGDNDSSDNKNQNEVLNGRETKTSGVQLL